MKILPIQLFLLGIIATALLSCQPFKKKCSRSYELDHPVSVFPIKESYHIGDTIWFEMNFSDVFQTLYYNNYNGQKFSKTIQLKNFDFHRNYLCLRELSDTSVNVAAQINSDFKESFEPIYETGTIVQEILFGPEYKLIYDDGHYKLKIGMVTKQKGVFLADFFYRHYYNEACLGKLNEQDLSADCETEIITALHFPVNKQPDGSHLTNYHLFEQWLHPDPAIEGSNIEHFQKECFTFVVD